MVLVILFSSKLKKLSVLGIFIDSIIQVGRDLGSSLVKFLLKARWTLGSGEIS